MIHTDGLQPSVVERLGDGNTPNKVIQTTYRENPTRWRMKTPQMNPFQNVPLSRLPAFRLDCLLPNFF